jgi:LysM repeat protein
VTAVNAEVTAARGPRPAATWTVRPGDTLSAIAAALGVPGGWQALYAANRQAIGPDPDVIRPGAVLTVPGRQGPARYTVAPGDTLSAIAAALGVPGGWQALYAANRQAIGPDPDVIRSGTVLAVPRSAAQGQPPQPAVPAPARTRQQAPPQHQSPAPASSRPPRPLHQAPAPAPAGRQPASRGTAPGHTTAQASAGGMPRWLQDVLLAVGVLAATAFAAEPAAALARRRRRGPPRARPAPGAAPRPARRAADKARIILADYERLIVTYCARDNAVYVLTPPGEDPRAVLRAARLVLPEDTYVDLAGHLGVPSAWPLE